MKPSFELFSDIFTYRDNALTRLDPRVKVMVALLTVLGTISSGRLIFPVSILVGSLIGMIAIRLPIRLTLMRLAAPLGMVLVLLVLQSLMLGSTPIYTISLLGRQISFMQEGALRGMLIGGRTLAAVSTLLLLSAVTPAHQIFHTLRWMGVPKGWVEMAMLMYRYIFSILDRAADAMVAQRLRLGYSSTRRSLSSLGTLAGSVLVLSMDQAFRTHEAMAMRGYKGVIPFAPWPALSGRDWWVTGLAATVLGLVYALTELNLL